MCMLCLHEFQASGTSPSHLPSEKTSPPSPRDDWTNQETLHDLVPKLQKNCLHSNFSYFFLLWWRKCLSSHLSLFSLTLPLTPFCEPTHLISYQVFWILLPSFVQLYWLPHFSQLVSHGSRHVVTCLVCHSILAPFQSPRKQLRWFFISVILIVSLSCSIFFNGVPAPSG